jgi:hypothetical protein
MMQKEMVCNCGDKVFSLRLYKDEGTGVVTCSHGHNSFLLESRDYWDLTLERSDKPRQFKCKCNSVLFTINLQYWFDQETGDVSRVDLISKCKNCGKVVKETFLDEIDYSPTDKLIAQPLDPCENPWLKAHHYHWSCLWKQEDFEKFTKWVMEIEDIQAYLIFDGHAQALPINQDEIIELVQKTPVWDLFFGLRKTLHSVTSVSWKTMPLLHVENPRINITKDGAITILYTFDYSKDILYQARISYQPKAFLKFIETVKSWLDQNYVSERGKNTFDNIEVLKRFNS